MRFTKMHGAGNDYVYVDCFAHAAPADPAAIAPVLADRIKVNITDFRLDQALSAIESKIEPVEH